MFHHIFNLDAVKFAKFQRVFHCKVGTVRVNVHFDKVQIANYKHAVADCRKEVAQFVDVGKRNFRTKINYEKFRAIAEIDMLVIVGAESVHRIKRDVFVFGRRVGNFDARKRVVHTLHHEHKSLSACVDDARFLQNRQHIGGLCKNFVAVCDDFFQKRQEFHRFFAPCKVLRLFRHRPDNRQYRAFFGLLHHAVRNFRALFQRLREFVSSERYVFIFRRNNRESFENLRTDNARIAASAFERAL